MAQPATRREGLRRTYAWPARRRRRYRGVVVRVDPRSRPPAEGVTRTRRHRRLLAAAAAACAVMLAAGIGAYLVVHQHNQQQNALLRPVGTPADVSTQLADLMQLSQVPSRLAPGFTLTDQHGANVSLASLRGHAVVLEFMDPHCTDICPIVSAELLDAYRDLGSAARNAVFVAVNVNPYDRGVAAMAAYSSEHELNLIPSWHFLTGSLASLRAVWRHYDISVSAKSPTADVVHTSEVVFIDPSGRERYVAAPMDDHTASGKAYLPANLLAQWGQGIAQVTGDLIR
jgi:cytochrome oxidase Cu insertion factor (SCO1/SenC/PrrC family)